ncbi:MAG: Uma2 family endonuclease [Planctomycetes bacterium]|nr:Uma2 family endonuclease [Planctomycetota bacterium]
MNESSTPKETPMKAVMWEVPPEIVELRRRTGADERDEVWDGVLHMGPSPNIEHQRIESDLERQVRTLWSSRTGGEVLHRINVSPGGDWKKNYRIPDLILRLLESRAIDRGEYVEGGPEVVVEILSPDDETYEKLPFYASIGVREVWVIDRDTKAVEVYSLAEGAYRLVAPDGEGWCASAVTGLQLRCALTRVELRWPNAS